MSGRILWVGGLPVSLALLQMITFFVSSFWKCSGFLSNDHYYVLLCSHTLYLLLHRLIQFYKIHIHTPYRPGETQTPRSIEKAIGSKAATAAAFI